MLEPPTQLFLIFMTRGLGHRLLLLLLPRTVYARAYDGWYRRVMLANNRQLPPRSVTHANVGKGRHLSSSLCAELVDNHTLVAQYGSEWGLTTCADIAQYDMCGMASWIPICPQSCRVCEALPPRNVRNRQAAAPNRDPLAVSFRSTRPKGRSTRSYY